MVLVATHSLIHDSPLLVQFYSGTRELDANLAVSIPAKVVSRWAILAPNGKLPACASRRNAGIFGNLGLYFSVSRLREDNGSL